MRELLTFIFRSTKRIAVFVIGVALVLLGIALIPQVTDIVKRRFGRRASDDAPPPG